MGRILRSLVAGGIGTLLGWIALPLCLLCSACALGLVETAGSPFDTHHGAARHAAAWVLVGLGAGVVGRIAHVLRALRVVSDAVRWRSVKVEVWRSEAGPQERLRVCTEAGEDVDATRRYEGFRRDRGGRRLTAPRAED